MNAAVISLLENVKNAKDDAVREEASSSVRNYVRSQNRELTGEAFSRFMSDLNKRIFELVNNSSPLSKIGGISVITKLIDTEYDETAVHVYTRFANHLRTVLSVGPGTDAHVMELASCALGKLARASDTLTYDSLEFEMNRALERLKLFDSQCHFKGERQELRRYGAVLVLKELATNSPSLFYNHNLDFFKLVWNVIRDPKVNIRRASRESLRAALVLINDRDSRQRMPIFRSLYEEAQDGISQLHTESIHGSIMVIAELIGNAGDFMQQHFKQVCEAVLKFRNHKDKVIRRAVIALIPLLAEFSPPLFGKGYLSTCMTHLLESLRNNQEKSECYIALGKIAMAVGSKIKPYVKNVLGMVKIGLSPSSSTSRGKATTSGVCPEALSCVSMFAEGLPKDLAPYMPALLPQMMIGGLSETLTEALTTISRHIPDLLPNIQLRLLDVLSMVLAHKPFSTPASSGSKQAQLRGEDSSGSSAYANVYNASQDTSPEVISLALHTMGSFDFSAHSLSSFIRECLTNYLDDDNANIRREAALTCTKLIVKQGQPAPTTGRESAMVAEVLEKLLIVGIADPDASIRQTVLRSLDSRYDFHLAQAENLRSLFVALNDEVFEMRELAINIIGRLTARNPAYVMPSLRKTLIVLLTELEFSGDSQVKEECAQLLGHLVRSSQELVKPYVDTILRALLPRLRDPSSRVTTCVLVALGELARVSGEAIAPHLDALFPLIIETLQDQSSSTKREVALKTLGQLASGTAYVIEPLVKYPQLLDLLLSEVVSEQNSAIRTATLKVLGLLGALDPYRHKLNQKSGPKDSGADSNELPTQDLNPADEEYYPTIAIHHLMRILNNPSLAMHHSHVIQAVVFMCKSLDTQSIQFLPQIMPSILQVLGTCEPGFREFLFQQLGRLVSIVRQHIRDWIEELFAKIKQFWDESLIIVIITLVEEICVALADEFKVYLPDMIPQFLEILHTDRTPKRSYTQQVLHAFEVFSTTLDDYLHLIVPAVVRLFEQVDVPIHVRSLAISTIGRLCDKLNFQDHASRIIHPIARVLDNPELRELHPHATNTLCELVYQLGSDYCIFIVMMNKILARRNIEYGPYTTLVSFLLKNEELTPDMIERVRSAAPGGNTRTAHRLDERARTDSGTPSMGNKGLKVDERNLQEAWDCSDRTTGDDWFEWIRNFAQELIRESPSPSLRACLALAQVYYPLARDLFNAAFYSCWIELKPALQQRLVTSLQNALLSDTIPPEILQQLLNLAEHHEHVDHPLPIDIRTFGALAAKCRAFAKALHYKEKEFARAPENTIEALISINNQLQQPQAAIGILVYAQQKHRVKLKESWYEKLGRWEDALSSYSSFPGSASGAVLGKMRCYNALGEWDLLAELSATTWYKHADEDAVLKKIAPLAAAAAWNLGKWESMAKYINVMGEDDVQATFFRSILNIVSDDFDAAQANIDRCRSMVDSDLAALVGESYNRAYDVMVKVQQLSELEEIIEFKRRPSLRPTLLKTWKRRLLGNKRNVEVWQRILAVRTLVLPPQDDLATWLKFAGLCRKAGRSRLSQHTLASLVNCAPGETYEQGLARASARVKFAHFAQDWVEGHREKAVGGLEELLGGGGVVNREFRATVQIKLGQWRLEMQPANTLPSGVIKQVLSLFHSATKDAPQSYKAWHTWALANYEVVLHYQRASGKASRMERYLEPAIHGFFKSIALGPSRSLQDTLRLLTLWFKHGQQPKVEEALSEGFNNVSIDTWLQVIPQVIARIHSKVPGVRRLIKELLSSVGQAHPQALVYPLTVASKSPNPIRLQAANDIIDHMRQHSPKLVEQASLVSDELIRVAIVWHEVWHEGLEEASRVYFTDNNTEAMIAALEPLHEMLEKGATTLREVAFQQAFGADLNEAWDWVKRYQKRGRQGDLNQAWDLYYYVFRKIIKQLPQMKTFELQYVSPELLAARDLELAVPGTYMAGEELVKIRSFQPVLRVIMSKQRPRRLSINGSDGQPYAFLLKGHEDLRQDERVMQLFGLINTLLSSDAATGKNHLRISRYAVVPLSPNSGVIGWVPDCDTLHDLIKEFRASRNIPLSQEHKVMTRSVANFDALTVLQKVHIFQKALALGDGRDLESVLWLKSRNSEVWLERRTNFTRSLSLMSMVGYILGLGDRHPSNLMLERPTGKVIHIDFGDCFEVAMQRDKYPEKVPFRLTRALVSAMEVSGIEGNFRSTAESVMSVLRTNKDSLMAVLEAFVHDPLINWRLLTSNAPEAEGTMGGGLGEDEVGAKKAVGQDADEDEGGEQLNERALTVISRIEAKLTGRDFGDDVLTIPVQCDRLIRQATSEENLAQAYVGWCSFW